MPYEIIYYLKVTNYIEMFKNCIIFYILMCRKMYIVVKCIVIFDDKMLDKFIIPHDYMADNLHYELSLCGF